MRRSFQSQAMAKIVPLKTISNNVLLVRMDEVGHANPTLVLNNEKYAFFRNSLSDGIIVYIKGRASDLNDMDIAALNDLCDVKENPANKGVKRNIGLALSRYFNNQSFHLNEIGCGKYPIYPYLQRGTPYTFAAIERNSECLAHLQAKKIAATDWEKAMQYPPVAKNRPTVAVSVYVLHFMINALLPERIKALTNAEGFFVGNHYRNPEELKTRKDHKALVNLFDNAGMPYIHFRDPSLASNEYWVVGQTRDARAIHTFASVLESSVIINNRQHNGSGMHLRKF